MKRLYDLEVDEGSILLDILRNQVILMKVNHRMMAKTNPGNFECLDELEVRVLATEKILGES